MKPILWQLFDLPRGAGRVAVPAFTEAEARKKMASSAWNGKDPGWPYSGTAVVPRPPWADWDRLERWSGRSGRSTP